MSDDTKVDRMGPIVMTTRKRPAACIQCGEEQDAATGGNGKRPKPGDFSICFTCGKISRFAEDLSFEEIPEDVWNELSAEDRAYLEDVSAQIKARPNRWKRKHS